MIKKFLFIFIYFILIILFFIILCESYLRWESNKIYKKGSKLENFIAGNRIYNPTYGWTLKKDFVFYYPTEENKIIKRTTNNLGFASNYNNNIKSNKYKILIIGDSFTEGLGVNIEDSWPNQMNKLINAKYNNEIEIYNLAVAGYNLDQYYFKTKEFAELIKPNLILIGFSTSTDFYDVGRDNDFFIYGETIGRNYFEILNDNLIENKSLNSIEDFRNILIEKVKSNDNKNSLQDLKKNFEQFKLYTKIKKTVFVINMISFFKNNGIILWPSSDIAISKDSNSIQKIKINLVEKIFQKFSDEFSTNSNLYVIHIPSFIEIDEKIWKSTYGKYPEKFNQQEGQKKIKKILDGKNINLITSLEELKIENNLKRTHLKYDGHLSENGNEIIAKLLVQNLSRVIKIK